MRSGIEWFGSIVANFFPGRHTQKLEQEGLIYREVFPEVPLHVEYHPTEKGRSLHRVIQVMDEWGEKYGK